MKRQAYSIRNRKSIAFTCVLITTLGISLFSACDISVPFDWDACWFPETPIADTYKVTGSCPIESGSNEYPIIINETDCQTFTLTNLFNTTTSGKVILHYEYDYSSTNDTLFRFSVAEQPYLNWIINGQGSLKVLNNTKTLNLDLTLISESQTTTCTINGRKK